MYYEHSERLLELLHLNKYCPILLSRILIILSSQLCVNMHRLNLRTYLERSWSHLNWQHSKICGTYKCKTNSSSTHMDTCVQESIYGPTILLEPRAMLHGKANKIDIYFFDLNDFIKHHTCTQLSQVGLKRTQPCRNTSKYKLKVEC